MTKQVDAVYENGVLRPLEPLPFQEHQRVRVTVSDVPEDWLDREFMARAAAEVSDAPTLEEVRQRLSKIPGSLTPDFIAEREGEIRPPEKPEKACASRFGLLPTAFKNLRTSSFSPWCHFRWFAVFSSYCTAGVPRDLGGRRL